MKTNNQSQRLQKVIASSGYCSRRKAEQLITERKVKVNNKIVTELGTKVTDTDVIKVNNQVLSFNQEIYLVFYKPINCLTTLKDPKHRPTIMPYFSSIKTRIYPVGRLDFDTTGLLLMTNDGAFANQILHPKYKVNKIYQVLCKGILNHDQITALQQGITIEMNITTAPAKVEILKVSKQKQQTLIKLTIHQGYKNQVKKMLKKVGSKVLSLKRIAIGNITLKDLKPGTYYYLSEKEKQDLLNLAQGH